jgi:uncharacterized protein (DUF342 family)
MKITLSENAQTGFDYIAAKEEKTVEALVSEIMERQGQAFYEDKGREETQVLLKKVESNPSAFKDSIETIHAELERIKAEAEKEEEI